MTGTVAVVDDGGHLGTTNVVTDAALGGLARTSPIVRAEIVAAPGQAGPLAAQLGRNLEILPRETPPEVRNLADLAPLPEILAAALAVVAGAAMAHTLITAARHHTREMAVLAAVGATPRQVRGMLAVLGGAIVAPGAGARRARRAGHRPVAVVAGGDVDRGRGRPRRPRSAC